MYVYMRVVGYENLRVKHNRKSDNNRVQRKMIKYEVNKGNEEQ